MNVQLRKDNLLKYQRETKNRQGECFISRFLCLKKSNNFFSINRKTIRKPANSHL